MIFRIIILLAIVVGMGFFIVDKCSEEKNAQNTAAGPGTISSIPTGNSNALSRKPAPRRPNSVGNAGVGYKYEYQDENGLWHPVMEFSQIPERYKSHFRPFAAQQAAAAPAGNNSEPAAQSQTQPTPPAVENNQGAPENKGGTEDSGTSEFEKQMKENEAKHREMAAKCKNLDQQLASARKAWDEVKDKIPPCQLKEEDCYEKYDQYKEKLKNDVNRLEKEYKDCREDARRAGVPPGYFR